MEFEDWMNAKFPQPQRPVSAPPPRSNDFEEKQKKDKHKSGEAKKIQFN